MQKKGSAVLISLLLGCLIIAGVAIYELQGGWNTQPTNFGYGADITQAKEAQIQVDFKAIQTGLEAYRVSKGQYPENLSQLVEADLISKIPNNSYTHSEYFFSSDGKNYTLSTKLKDGSDYQITN